MALYLQPDSPELPPGSVEPDAPRYERLAQRALTVRQRMLCGGAGALVALGGAWLGSLDDTWVTAVVGIGIALILFGLDGGRRLYEYCESANGTFVLAPATVEARITERRDERVRASLARARAGAGLVGAVFLIGFLGGLARLIQHPGDWLTLLWTGPFAAGMLWFAITGDAGWLPFFGSEELEAASPRFHELADPARPLPPEAVRDAAASDDLSRRAE
ncbi:MAG: hypothetical protein ACJ8GN_17130 [Longimicrobiaceae bacterium]